MLDATTQPGRKMCWCTAPKQKCRRQSLNTLSESRAAGQNGTSDDLRVSERPSAARKKHAACPWRCLCKNWCEHKARNRVARTRDATRNVRECCANFKVLPVPRTNFARAPTRVHYKFQIFSRPWDNDVTRERCACTFTNATPPG